MELLIVLSPERRSIKAVDHAVKLAAEKKLDLRAVYVLEESITKAVEKDLAEIGFIGDKPGHEIADALAKEHTSRGQKIIEEIELKAKVQGVRVTTEMVSGFYFQVCDEFIQKKSVAEIVVLNIPKGIIKRLLSGDEIKFLKASTQKSIHVFDVDSF